MDLVGRVDLQSAIPMSVRRYYLVKCSLKAAHWVSQINFSLGLVWLNWGILVLIFLPNKYPEYSKLTTGYVLFGSNERVKYPTLYLNKFHGYPMLALD